MTFQSTAKVLQRTVFDRPVLDKTGLAGQYTFILKWRADETQFSQMRGMEMPVEEGTADLDDIYTAARKQLGVQITTGKQIAPTLVIESISHPTSN